MRPLCRRFRSLARHGRPRMPPASHGRRPLRSTIAVLATQQTLTHRRHTNDSAHHSTITLDHQGRRPWRATVTFDHATPEALACDRHVLARFTCDHVPRRSTSARFYVRSIGVHRMRVPDESWRPSRVIDGGYRTKVAHRPSLHRRLKGPHQQNTYVQ